MPGCVAAMGTAGTRTGRHRRGGQPPALVLGAGVTGLAVLRSLGRSGIPALVAGADTSTLARSRWYRRAPGEAIDESPDGVRLARYLESTGLPKAVLIPASDDWALAVGSLPARLGDAYPGIVAPEPVLRTLIDKQSFARTVRELDVPAPQTIAVTGAETLEAVAEADVARFFLKPRDSQQFTRQLGVKALMVTDRASAAELLARVERERLDVLLQEFIPGPPQAHVFLDGYVDRAGAMRACLARRRLRMYPPQLGNSTRSVTIGLDEVSPAVADLRRLFEAISYRGLFDAEFKHDARDGRFKLLEVNARPWWQLELAGVAGLDVCLMAYRDALGEPLPGADRYRIGCTWVNPVPDLRAWWSLRGSPNGRGDFPLRAWTGGANAVFSLDDPLPALEQIALSAGRAAIRVASHGRQRLP